MRAAFLIYDFTSTNLPLQPWLTISCVAKRLFRKGHEVHIITDTDRSVEFGALNVHCLKSIRNAGGSKVNYLIEKICPDVLVSLPTPLNILSERWLRALKARMVAFASYPFYNSRELYLASKLLTWNDVRPFLRHILVPEIWWQKELRNTFDAIITQSFSTAARLKSDNKARSMCVEVIPPGIDLKLWPFHRKSRVKKGVFSLLYLGSATAIRGFDVLLKSMGLVSDLNLHLNVLARGASALEVKQIQAKAQSWGVGHRITVTGGWCNREKLINEIHNATAVVLPFVLVPSELPVTVMEVIACGTPVIGSDLDGLPSAIGPAGAVVQQGNAKSLGLAIRGMCIDSSALLKWQEACQVQRELMLDWDEVTEHWETVLRG